MKYQRKPLIVDAFRWTGDIDQSEDPEWACEAIKDGRITFCAQGTPACSMLVRTPGGIEEVQHGYFLVKFENGDFGVYAPTTFHSTYDRVEG